MKFHGWSQIINLLTGPLLSTLIEDNMISKPGRDLRVGIKLLFCRMHLKLLVNGRRPRTRVAKERTLTTPIVRYYLRKFDVFWLEASDDMAQVAVDSQKTNTAHQG
jgi:hypothetical protein